MRKVFLSLSVVVVLFAAGAAVADECGVAGTCAGGMVWGCEREYNHLRNWRFEDACEWTYSPHTQTNLGAYRAVDQNMCGGSFQSDGYGKLVPPQSGTTSKIYQLLTPVYETGFTDQWIVGYNFEFEDPYLSSLNTVRVKVINRLTNTTVAQSTLHRGSNGDPNCNRYNFTFTAALNNVPIKLEVVATWGGPVDQATFANIDNIVLANVKQQP